MVSSMKGICRDFDNFSDRVISQWVRVKSVNGYGFAKEGDYVSCVRWVVSKSWENIQWKVFQILKIVIIYPETAQHGIEKRIQLVWFGQELFNPKRFRLIAKEWK